MITEPKHVLQYHEIRKTKKQKEDFRSAVLEYFTFLGYNATVEGKKNTNNVVVGNPEKAKFLITAHYDTPANMYLPNLITPCNLFLYLAWQLLVVGIISVLSAIPAVAVELLLDSPLLGLFVWYAVYFLMFIVMLTGPANKHNANDNTSGVVTVLEIAKSLPENLREKVCFVLFDLEEAGLVGSKLYANTHKAAIQNQTVLNLDCVGEGNELVLFPSKKMLKKDATCSCLQVATGSFGEKNISVHTKGFAFYPSDQKNFPNGVGVAAFNRTKVGLFLARIHTKRDTILDYTNVNLLRAALISVVSSAAE